MNDSSEQFGCGVCWPIDAETAYVGYGTLAWVAELIDESHYIVRVAACRSCGQRYLTVFTEMIDWEDGDDPCNRRMLPLTKTEADSLQAVPTEEQLMAIAPGRKCLAFDHPKAAPGRAYWVSGLQIWPHD